MKKIIILILSLVLVVSIFAIAKQQARIGKGEFELVFDNIVIDELIFVDGDEIEIKSKKNDVIMEKRKLKIFISADDKTKITLLLPIQNSYLINGEDGEYCSFNSESVKILGKDGEKINFSEDGMEINNDDEQININSKGIYIESEDEQISISSSGIIVKNDEEDIHLTGFWGSLLGSAIQGVSGTAVSWVGRNPEKIVKSIVNRSYDDVDNSYNLNWSISDSNLSDRPFREFTGIFRADKKREINVSNRNGNVNIFQWDEDYVNVHAKIYVTGKVKDADAEFKKVKIEILEKDGCTVKTNFLKKNAKISVSYIIKVPRDFILGDIYTSNGNINLKNTNGGKLNSSNGNITIISCRGDLNAATSNGLIKAVDLGGILYANTSNGMIHAENVENIKSLRTSNARIYAEILNLDKDTNISSSNGNVKIAIVESVSCELEASTSNGSIQSGDLNIEFKNKSKDYIKGDINGGGNRLMISSSNGNIIIEELSRLD